MGSCFSKKGRSAPPECAARTEEKPKSEAQLVKTKRQEETLVKKEVFIIKHRRSHELHPSGELKKLVGDSAVDGVVAAPARRPSCSKEDVDAILIQCGRLSRNSSTSRAENDERKNLALKRSCEFDEEPTKSEGSNSNVAAGDEDAAARERDDRRGLSLGRRRRTPSREREKTQPLNYRSGSIERGSSSSGGGGGGRRVSRSPGRRSQSPISSRNNSNSNSLAINAKPSKPQKMVSVPATVQLDKSINADSNPTTAAKRIPIKRNVAGTASPRTRSPARARTSNENPPQPQSLSRSNSKRAEHSPFRRNPLAEIDTNIISQTPQANKQNNKSFKNNNNEEQELIFSDPKLTRTRSSRLSRDLDINPEVQDTKISSYTSLLLEDIQNFHQKRAPPTDFALPACVTKACSILEAVADLNSSIGSDFSTTLMEDQRREKLRKCTENKKALESNPEKIKDELGEPVFESMIVDTDDLMPPSFEKYVTVKRGVNGGGEEIGEVESSGSNSIAGSQQQMVFSATKKEPNSAESTHRWMFSSADTRRSATKTNNRTPNSKKKDSFSPHR